MGSWRGGGHGAWAALDCVLAALTSWLAALLSILRLRGEALPPPLPAAATLPPAGTCVPAAGPDRLAHYSIMLLM